MQGLYNNMLLPNLGAFRFLRDVGGKVVRRQPGQEPTREHLVLSGDRPLNVDIYRPATAAKAGLLVIPGVAAKGKDDPRLINFATSMARNGFGVIVPDLESLRRLEVQVDHYKDVVAAFQHLLADPTLAPGGRAGLGGLSFAMGPAMRASLDPAIREQVNFLFCIGGYHSIMQELRYVTTGTHSHPERGTLHLKSDHYGRWVVMASLLVYLEDERSRLILREMVDRRIPNEFADLADLDARLVDPGARALYDLILNQDPALVQPLFDKLPRLPRENYLAMDLASLDLSQLHARLILVHGYEDLLIPFTESLALYRRAPAGHKRLYLVNGLGHVNLNKPGPIDAWAMLSAVTALLREQRR